MRAGKPRFLRRLLLCGWSVGMVLRVSGGASGQDAAAPSARPPKPAPANNLTSEETFQALIEDLGSSQFARRESAADALRLGGQSALKALRRAQNHPDAEVRRRAAELQGPLEASLRLAPKRVSLERKSRTLRATLEEISKSTGYTVEAWNNLEQQVDFGCDNITLLEAVDQLGRLTGTVLQQGYGDDRIRLGAGNCPPLVAYDGPFRLVATSLQQYRNIDLANANPGSPGASVSGPGRTETLTLGMAIFSEPRLPLLGVNEPRLTEAWTEDGQSLLPPANDAANTSRRHVSRYGNGYRSQTQMANVVLRRPSGSSGSIKTISGVVSCLVLVDQKQIPITTELAKSKGKSIDIASTSFTIDEVTGVGDAPGKPITVKLSVREKNNDNPGDYTWMNSLYQRLELTDAEGNKFQNQGSNWGTSGPNFATITFTFGPPIPQQNAARAKVNIRGLVLPGIPAPAVKPAPAAKPAGPPTKLLYTTWETMDHQVPFTFKDLPLP